MSLFGSIWEKITGHAQAATPGNTPAAAPGNTPAAAPGGTPAAPPPGDSPSPASATAMPQVDVAAVLDGLARESRQRLDWRHSIVDLLKLLSLDSSQASRRELATELGYSGDAGDSAAMNIWLHAQVMRKLAENGGKVPEDLRT